jgi:hypothetical protein
MNDKIGVTITKKTQQQVTWELLKTLADECRIEELLAVGDELQVELKTGEAVAFQLADLCMGTGGRPCFILKECLKDEKPMNKTNTNKGGWKKSFMREWLNETIFHQLPDELQAIVMPRVIKQKLGSKTVETVDKLWLPSHTEMFGADAEWAPADTEDAQLALFRTERSRVKECAGRGTWWYWLRSPHGSTSTDFCYVSSNGSAHNHTASTSRGVAFGFCI